jgi:transcriptional regulator with XRE-family HTH domain
VSEHIVTFSANLRRLMHSGVSSETLAEKSGLDRRTVNRARAGTAVMLDTACRLAAGLGYPLHDLVGAKIEPDCLAPLRVAIQGLPPPVRAEFVRLCCGLAEHASSTTLPVVLGMHTVLGGDG